VVNAQDPYDHLVVVDVVQQAVRASTGTQHASEFATQRLADKARLLREVAESKLDDR